MVRPFGAHLKHDDVQKAVEYVTNLMGMIISVVELCSPPVMPARGMQWWFYSSERFQ
jgi:hypothetical protein